MITRRNFIATSSATALALAASRVSRAAVAPDRIGVQLWVLRELLAKDFDGTLAQVAAIGIRKVEFAGFFNRSAEQVRTVLASTGLTATGAHCLVATTTDEQLKHTIEFCHTVGMHYMIAAVPSIKPGSASGSGNPFDSISLDDWHWSIDRFNEIGAKVREAGMRFAYHNHNMEARRYGNIVAFDEVLRLTDPSVVGIEFDIGNFVAGGGDPYPYLAKYPQRFELAHVKEWADPFTPTVSIKFPDYAPLGKGKTDWKRLIAALDKTNVKEIFIEQDGTAAKDEVGAVSQAYQFLKTV